VQVIFKMDGHGHCVSIKRETLACIKEFPMHGWTDMQFRRMAVGFLFRTVPQADTRQDALGLRLSRFYTWDRDQDCTPPLATLQDGGKGGLGYMDKGMGLMGTPQIIQNIRLEGAMLVPPTYAVDFAQAELAFLHQRVYDPETERLVPLSPFPEGGLQTQDERWIGL
jgi:exonuclease-1